jgi:hypothetical protein
VHPTQEAEAEDSEEMVEQWDMTEANAVTHAISSAALVT